MIWALYHSLIGCDPRWRSQKQNARCSVNLWIKVYIICFVNQKIERVLYGIRTTYHRTHRELLCLRRGWICSSLLSFLVYVVKFSTTVVLFNSSFGGIIREWPLDVHWWNYSNFWSDTGNGGQWSPKWKLLVTIHTCYLQRYTVAKKKASTVCVRSSHFTYVVA